MAPLIVQLVAWAGFWLVGLVGLLQATATVAGALRFALAVMFVFTAMSHFLPQTRPDLVRMVPRALAALLVALFPANIHAAREGLHIAGRRATPLILRLPLQLFWIGCLLWVASTASAGLR